MECNAQPFGRADARDACITLVSGSPPALGNEEPVRAVLRGLARD